MRLKRVLIAAIGFSFALSLNAQAAVTTMPSVSKEMLDPEYWLEDVSEPDKVLVTREDIRTLNRSFITCKDCNMYDLFYETGSFNGKEDNLKRWKSAMTDLAIYLDGAHYDAAEKTVSGQYVMEILKNVEDPDAKEKQDLRYGIAVRQSDVRAFPTDLIIADDPGDNDFDNVQVSGIRLGEPVTIRAVSEDGKYYLCHTSCVSGWIPSEVIAICKDRAEWLKAWDFPADKVMVVTASKLTLEESNTSPELSGLMLTMGTVLKKADPSEYGDLVTNRSLYYNYPVWIPVRNDKGGYEKRLALISMHHEVSDGYLPLTHRNIVKQAYNKLGDAYGWGGMLSAPDCSSYVRDVYKCFGIELPRNTTWQAAMPVEKYDISAATDEEKMEFFKELDPGTILFFKGHEMIYLGNKDGKCYVISSSSSMMDPAGEDKKRIRSVIINSLDAKRANGNTWISELYEAAVPYVANKENISLPIFDASKNVIKRKPAVSGNTVSGNDAYEEISFDKSWEYGDKAKITEGKARLYRSDAADRKNVTVCINAGHGTKDGTRVKTQCHPDGSPKVVTGSTAAGATEAVAISDGAVMKNGDMEAVATLKAAMKVKDELLKKGYDVLMIRETDDVQLDNIARTLIADNYADAHIALHYDSTDTDKGVFYCSVPDEGGYRDMEPVKTHWRSHEKLGKSLIYGLQKSGFKTFGSGALAMDLTQTSYSTIPSVDLEIGDTASDYSDKTLAKVAEGITEGLDHFFDK